MDIRPSKRAFTISLIVLAVILVAFGLLRMKFGQFLPASIDKNLPDTVMFAAVGIMLWNKKLRNDEQKAEKERKRLEEEALAAKSASDEAEKECPSAEVAATPGEAATTSAENDGKTGDGSSGEAS
jgi:hypothetical protein